ncbi:MAG: hypothetical protein RJB60_2551 [Pseudomonadota bacterium]|jgi:hypothetical protein
MSPTPIGKLQRVPLREVWKHEAYDFTQWLQQNLDVLNTALGLNLVNAEREQAAGSFSIDLVAEDDGGGTVVIENQLEKSNHDHLGKLITYVTAMQARAAVWIISEPRRACRLRITVAGGYRAPEAEWASIHDNVAAAMNALNAALQPYLKKLKLGS